MIKKSTYLLISIVFIIVIKIIYFINNPLFSVDGPWAMSQTFSYIIGLKDKSVFAHEFLGNAFTVDFVVFLQSIWFKIFDLGTYSYIGYHFFIICCSFCAWIYLAKKHFKDTILVYFLMFGYFISTYLYGFRPENFVVLIQLFFLIVLFSTISRPFKLLLLSFLCLLTGLIHHVGGFITVILSIYYFVFVTKKYNHFFLFIIYGIVLAFIFTKGELVNYLLLPTKFNSEVNNHFSNIDFKLFIKYFIYSGPIPIVILYVFRKLISKTDWIFILLFILLLSFLGRSYYVVYIYVVLLFYLIHRNKTEADYFSKFEKSLILSSLMYSLLLLFIVPLILNALSNNSNMAWRKVISEVKQEKMNWDTSKKYFVPSQLSLEVVDQSNTRLLYPFMKQNDGIQDTKNKIFYIYNKDQIKWIEKNFNTKNKKMYIEEMLPENPGHLIISSLYKFKKLRSSPFGLWKIYYAEEE